MTEKIKITKLTETATTSTTVKASENAYADVRAACVWELAIIVMREHLTTPFSQILNLIESTSVSWNNVTSFVDEDEVVYVARYTHK